MRNISVVFLLVAALALESCSSAYRGIITSEERRIWVVRHRSDTEYVYRCSDLGDNDQPPRPVCVEAVMNEVAR